MKSRWRCVLEFGSNRLRLSRAIINEYEVVVI